MKLLTYDTLDELGYDGYLLKGGPERVLQFGEGNFMRAFADYFIDVMNERAGFNSKVVLVQPIGHSPQMADRINAQEGLYTLYLRGFEKGRKVSDKRILSCVSRCINPYTDFQAVLDCAAHPELRYITCNTTEAGIAYDPACQFTDDPPSSYPGKLTCFLYERFQKFGQEKGKGFVILACELIDNNGKELEKCVLQYADQWQLGEEFSKWIEEENIFCSTLVDRIVTGYPLREAESLWEENGYKDNLINTGEVFGFWVIEGPEALKAELPFEEAGLPVLITPDHKPYKQRKVGILNGAHTSMALGAYLAGQDIVRDCMDDPVIADFMNQAIYAEIIPTLTLPEEELKDFAAAVTERFKNPFIDHKLLDISLNSTAKWKARVLPSLKGYVEKFGKLPQRLTASLAFYIAFFRPKRYEDSILTGQRGQDEYKISDDKPVLDFFWVHKDDDNTALAHAVLANEAFWGEDLTKITGLEKAVAGILHKLDTKGAYEVMK